jgi:hypothetical protein
MQHIALTNGGFALVDDADYQDICQYTWHRRGTAGPAQRSERHGRRTRTIYMHRQIMQAAAGTQVDHRDGNKLNNTRDNLRLATNTTNQQNRRKKAKASSKYKGVHQKGTRWCARIAINGTRIHLGYFATDVEAARAYNNAAISHFGEFACLNNIENTLCTD